MSSFYYTIACVSGSAAIGAGAFGAHGLKSSGADAAQVATWTTAAHYHLLHSAVLLCTSRWGPAATLPNFLLTSGITLFSGSLYALVLTGVKSLGAITPIGGLLLMAGWLALATVPSTSFKASS